MVNWRRIDMKTKIGILAALCVIMMLIGIGTTMSDQAGSITGASEGWGGGSLSSSPASDLGAAAASTGMAGYYEGGNYQAWDAWGFMNFLFGGVEGINNGLSGTTGPGSNSAAASSINSGLSSFTGSSVGGSDGGSGGNFGF
jgi:hypothetical protein